MARHLPATSASAPVRVIHYVDPAPPDPAELVLVNPRAVAAREQERRLAYLHWRERQDRIAERDRKARRFWLGFGAVLALALLAAIAAGGWLLWSAVTAAVVGPVAVLLVLVAVVGVVGVGHRCVTVIQHWH